MAPQRFNPFEDRLSRDIRNALSETIIEVLGEHSIEAAQNVASTYRQQNLEQIYRDYIDQRLDRYTRALAILKPGDTLLHQAAVLWDLDLFFEVHEILEPAWIAADGNEKRLLQALIRSAGVYINLELGYEQRAAKIAAKAIPVLKESGAELTSLIRVGELRSALETLSSTPPRISRS